MAASLGGPLELQDEGSFFVNGRQTQSSHPGTSAFSAPQPGTITVNQMYVHYRIPKTVSGPPIVMVHGSGHTGMTYETTPDGREGWATYFARKGFPVYVVDHSGRGRSGFDPTAINRARAARRREALPDIPIAHARARLVLLPHRQGLSDAVSRLAVSGRGARPVLLAARAQRRDDARAAAAPTPCRRLRALLDKIGPAIVMVHSQSGAYGHGSRAHSEPTRCARSSTSKAIAGRSTSKTITKIFAQGADARGLGRQQRGRAGTERRRTPQRLS